MQVFTTCIPVVNTHPELGNGKRYHTLANNKVTEINTSAASDLLSAHRGNPDPESEPRILRQGAVAEQIGNSSASSTKQLEDMTRPIQRMPHAIKPNFPKRRIQVLVLAQPVYRPTNEEQATNLRFSIFKRGKLDDFFPLPDPLL